MLYCIVFFLFMLSFWIRYLLFSREFKYLSLGYLIYLLFFFCSSSDQVRLCILTETNDVTAQIHQKLVEAFCWENDIPIIMVDSYRKMVTGEDDIDIGCILIQSSTNDKYTEEFIEHYYAMITKHHPVVHLPDWGIVNTCLP